MWIRISSMRIRFLDWSLKKKWNGILSILMSVSQDYGGYFANRIHIHITDLGGLFKKSQECYSGFLRGYFLFYFMFHENGAQGVLSSKQLCLGRLTPIKRYGCDVTSNIVSPRPSSMRFLILVMMRSYSSSVGLTRARELNKGQIRFIA